MTKKIFITIILISSLFSSGFSSTQLKAQTADIENEENLPVVIAGEEDYQSSFRNPFSDYRPQVEEDETEEEDEESLEFTDNVWAEIPFKLQGIITYEAENIALLYSPDNPRVVKAGEEVNNYRITAIFDEFIEITRNQQSRYMEIGGGLREIEE